jgi:hypothetical protein
MKIFHAVFGSDLETLEQSQGLGFLYRSVGFPEALMEDAKNFGYPLDAGGHPVFSFKTPKISDACWLLMNRTVQTTDYTQRVIFISHSIAIYQPDFSNFINQRESAIPSVFEFMKNVEWVSSWNGKPQVLDDASDLGASAAKAFQAESRNHEIQIDAHPLLAFDYSKGDIPKPKRAIWQFQDTTPEEMLRFFHLAWLCLDPWQGKRKRKCGDHLDEPRVSILDSWQCSFTTNLRHGQSGEYQWVVASPDCPSIPNRELIEPSRWPTESPESIKAVIGQHLGQHLGDLLVDRCVQGPVAWAQPKLKLLRAELKQEYSQKTRMKSEEIKDQVEAIVSDFRKKVHTSKVAVDVYEKNNWWHFDREDDIDIIRSRLDKLEESVKTAAESQKKEYLENSNSVARCLENIGVSGNDDLMDEPPFFPGESFKEFEKLVGEYKNACRIKLICDLAIEADKSKKELTKLNEELNKKLEGQQVELATAKTAYDRMYQQRSSTGNEKNQTRKTGGGRGIFAAMTWQTTALICSGLINLLTVIWIYVDRDHIKEKLRSNKQTTEKK